MPKIDRNVDGSNTKKSSGIMEKIQNLSGNSKYLFAIGVVAAAVAVIVIVALFGFK